MQTRFANALSRIARSTQEDSMAKKAAKSKTKMAKKPAAKKTAAKKKPAKKK